MWLRMSFAAVLSLVLAGAARAQDCGSSFSQSLAIMKDGTIELHYQVQKPVFVSETRAITVFESVEEIITETLDGKPQTRRVVKSVPVTKEVEVTVAKMVCEGRVRILDESNTAAYDAAGKLLAWDDLSQRLAKPALVMVTTTGKPLPAQLAAALKPTTIVLAPAAEPQFAPVPHPVAPVEPAAPILVEPREGPINQTAPTILPIAPAERRPRPAPAERVKEAPAPQGVFKPAVYQVVADEPEAAAAELPSMPTSTQPALKLASLAEEGSINVTSLDSFEHTNDVTWTDTDDEGEPKGEPQTIPLIQRIETRTTTVYPLDFVEAVTVDGRKVPSELLTRYLKSERAVLVASRGAKVDKFWLQNMKATTVILSVPEVLGQGYATPAVAPALPAVPDAPAPPPPAP